MLNIYYELATNRARIVRYWVQTNAKKRNGVEVDYRSNLMWNSERVWLEEKESGRVRFLKNRYAELANELLADEFELFNSAKSQAMDLSMMSMRKFSEGVIYVSFPPQGYRDDTYLIPEGLEEWLEQNAKPDWGIVKGQRAGVFLSEQDATAFKLRWM